MTGRWNLHVSDIAENDLAALPKETRKRVVGKLEWLEQNFEDITPLTLSNEWTGFYKLRVGDYRVIYRVNWERQQLVVEAVDHRSKVYKRRR